MDFALPPKTGQRKIWLLRLLPEKLDAAKPGIKNLEAAIKNLEAAIKNLEAAMKNLEAASQKLGSRMRLPEKRIADGFGSPQKSGIRTKKPGVRKKKSGVRNEKPGSRNEKTGSRKLGCATLGAGQMV